MKTYAYVSLAQSIRNNGHRHLANGDRHAAAGNIEYANGSWRKAKRNYDRANSLEQMFRVVLPKPLEAAFELMKQQVSKNIYGV